jgi:hypothetical protein
MKFTDWKRTPYKEPETTAEEISEIKKQMNAGKIGKVRGQTMIGNLSK